MIKTFFKRLLRPTYLKRLLFFFISDILIIIVSLYLSFLLRHDFRVRGHSLELIRRTLPLFLAVKASVFLAFRLGRITWRYVGLRDVTSIVEAVAVSELILIPLVLYSGADIGGWHIPSLPGYPISDFPRSVFLIDAGNSLIMLLVLRVSKRFYLEVLHRNGKKGEGLRTIIVGAGNAGEMILRDMVRQENSPFRPVGLVDDDLNKVGAYIHGIKVLNTIGRLKDAVLAGKAEAVIIAIPSLNHKTLRSIYDTAIEAELKTVKIIPRIYDHSTPEVNLKNLESIKIEDLIGRQAVRIDSEGIKRFLKGKVVLITGAGGSIGAEITAQACAFGAGLIVLFDIDETELHNMELKLKKEFPHFFVQADGRGTPGGEAGRIVFAVGDIRDKARVDELFRTFMPQIVFHAAAYKHVPMMEYNPKEAVKANIFGTYRIAHAAAKNRVERFVMISTDKAVRPTSVMGATKRVAEHVCAAFNAGSKTEFMSVRFGNVLGSRGSVVPLFLEQLKNGGPLTVTHEEMKRYFMTIPEAVSLVLQAAVIGKGGEVLVLDMGEPIRIVDLARDLIRLHGLEPHRDVDIEFTDPRPGEKLFEEILTAEEGTTASKHSRIFTAKVNRTFSLEEIRGILAEFEEELSSPFTAEGEGRRLRNLLRKYVKHYEPSNETERDEEGAGVEQPFEV